MGGGKNMRRHALRRKAVCIAASVSLMLSMAMMTSCSSGDSTDKKYDELIEEAADYLDNDKLKKAIGAYEDAIELDPDRPEAYLALAELYVDNDQLEEAEDILKTGKRKTHDEDIIVYLEVVQELIGTDIEPTDVPTITPEIIISATPTNSPTPVPTLQADPEEVKAAAYSMYWDVLYYYGNQIDRYAQHYCYSTDEFITVDDFNDDGIPDLMFMEQPGTEEYESANLHIFTYDPASGEAIEVLTYPGLDFLAASGGVYTIFSLKDSDEIGIMSAGGDEDWYISLSLRRIDSANADNTTTDSLEYVSMPNWDDNGDYSTTTVEVTHNGQTYGQDYYDNYVNELASRVDKILLSNESAEYNMFDWVTWDSIAMTPDEARNFLEGSPEGDYSAISGTYWFSSGAGGWATEMTIRSDGTFTGYYYDHDFASEEDDYDAIMYMSEFEGTFTDIQQVDSITYTMQLATLNFTKSEADSHIEDVEGVRTLISYGLSAYGLDNAGPVTVYLPGTLKTDLPEEALMWYNSTAGYGDADSDTITVNCLYNINGEQAWTREY